MNYLLKLIFFVLLVKNKKNNFIYVLKLDKELVLKKLQCVIYITQFIVKTECIRENDFIITS